MPDYLGEDQRRVKKDSKEDETIQGLKQGVVVFCVVLKRVTTCCSCSKSSYFATLVVVSKLSFVALDEGDIQILKTYVSLCVRLLTTLPTEHVLHTLSQGSGPYNDSIKQTEDDITAAMKKVNELAGTKESDTGLAVPALWDLAADKQALQTEEPLQVSTGLSLCV